MSATRRSSEILTSARKFQTTTVQVCSLSKFLILFTSLLSRETFGDALRKWYVFKFVFLFCYSLEFIRKFGFLGGGGWGGYS